MWLNDLPCRFGSPSQEDRLLLCVSLARVGRKPSGDGGGGSGLVGETVLLSASSGQAEKFLCRIFLMHVSTATIVLHQAIHIMCWDLLCFHGDTLECYGVCVWLWIYYIMCGPNVPTM